MILILDVGTAPFDLDTAKFWRQIKSELYLTFPLYIGMNEHDGIDIKDVFTQGAMMYIEKLKFQKPEFQP
jgi:hypothetical protein